MDVLTIAFQLFILFCISKISFCEVIVNIKQGTLSGILLRTLLLNKQYTAFRGIPFAEPPTGNSRFTAPTPHGGWDGVYKAHKEKEACVQYNHNVKKGAPFGVYGAEDCLYLDVFTPSIDVDMKLPVIVFLYNEYFRNSYNKTDDYAPDFIIEEDVIVVTISHRLSVFGFLSFEDEVLPGNSGLKDVMIALEWIRDNIRMFGGDTERISIMGVQGGAVIADILLHTQNAEGLFSAVIMQGGSSWQSIYFPGESQIRALKLAKELNIKSSRSQIVLNKLSEASVYDLLSAEIKVVPDYFSRNEQKSILPFGPIIENYQADGVVTKLPGINSKILDVPIMIGFNSREGIDGAADYLVEPTFITSLDRHFPLILPIRSNFRFEPFDSQFYNAIEEIKNFYFMDGTVKISKPSEYITYIGDVLIEYPIDYTVQNFLNISNLPIYYYNFDYSGSLNENKINFLKVTKTAEGTWGAAVGDELCYLLVCPRLKETYVSLLRDGGEEIVVLRRMVRLWTNFAKYRNPTPVDDDVLSGFIWKPVTKENKSYLQIRDNLKMRHNLNSERFKFWDNFLSKYSKLARNGVIANVKDEL